MFSSYHSLSDSAMFHMDREPLRATICLVHRPGTFYARHVSKQNRSRHNLDDVLTTYIQTDKIVLFNMFTFVVQYSLSTKLLSIFEKRKTCRNHYIIFY